jgi:predicted anti-sigma-YlaC factor YlaD
MRSLQEFISFPFQKESRPGMADERTMSCQEFVELVTEYLENNLLPEVRELFDEHRGVCPGCETYFEQIRQTISTLRSIGEEQVPPETKQKLLLAFRQLQSKKE